jgi:hypothetical protein
MLVLQNDNWIAWKKRAQTELKAQNLWYLVEHAEDINRQMTHVYTRQNMENIKNGKPALPDPQKAMGMAVALAKHMIDDDEKTAKAKIAGWIGEQDMGKIDELHKLGPIWKKLEESHLDKSNQALLKMASDIEKFKMGNCKDMEDYLTGIHGLWKSLTAAGGIMTEEQLCMKVCANVTHEYVDRAENLLDKASGDKPLEFDHVSKRLLAAEQRLLAREEEKGGRARGLVASSSNSLEDIVSLAVAKALAAQSSSGTGGRLCHHCSRKGHTAETCWRKFPHLMPEWAVQQRERNKAKRKDDQGKANAAKEVALRVRPTRLLSMALDSGATSDCLAEQDHDLLACVVQPDPAKAGMETANGEVTRVKGQGILRASTEEFRKFTCENVLTPTGFAENLKSVSAWCEKKEGNYAVFHKTGAGLYDASGDLVARASRDGGLYMLKIHVEIPDSHGRESALLCEEDSDPRAERAEKRAARRDLEKLEQQRVMDDEIVSDVVIDDDAGLGGGVSDEKKGEEKSDLQAREKEAALWLLKGQREAFAQHQRLNHLNLKLMKEMVRDGEITISKAAKEWMVGKTKFVCVPCDMGKVTKTPLPKKSIEHNPEHSDDEAIEASDDPCCFRVIVRAGGDLNGPHALSVGSYAGRKYALLVRMQATRYSWLRFIRDKSDANATLRTLIPLIKATMKEGTRLAFLTDIGGEFCGAESKTMFEELGVLHETTSRNSSLQNACVERHWRTLEQDVATMREQSGLTRGYWPDLMETAHEIRLRLPCQGLPDRRSPWLRTHCDPVAQKEWLDRLHPVGCLAVCTNVTRASMGLRGSRMVYLGPARDTKDGKRLLHIKTRRIVTDRGKAFHDHLFPCTMDKVMREAKIRELLEEEDIEDGDVEIERNVQPDVELSSLDSLNSLSSNSWPWAETEEEERWQDAQEAGEPRRSKRVTFQRDVYQGRLEELSAKFYKNLADSKILHKRRQSSAASGKGKKKASSSSIDARKHTLHAQGATAMRVHARALVASVIRQAEMDHKTAFTPKNYAEAKKHPEWLESIYVEYDKLWKMGAFEVVDAPPGANIMLPTLVFKTKLDKNNKVIERKSRACAMGNTQQHGQDFFETFAPTVRMDTVRLFFQFATEKGWNIKQADVRSAFLIPMLPEEEKLYMRPFPGMAVPQGKVLRLLKALYGTRQAARLWHQHLRAFLLKVGYVRCSDPCLYRRIDPETGEVQGLVLFHVDDLLAAGTEEELSRFMTLFEEAYEATSGDVDFFLGMRVLKTRDGYFLSQDAYISRLVERFQWENARPASTPIKERLYASAADDAPEQLGPGAQKKYRELVGGLMYAMLCTRPDLSFAINQFTRHFNNPQRSHWLAALRCLSYVRDTKTMGLRYKARREELPLEVWTDSDWAGDRQTRKSTQGCLVLAGGSVVSYSAKAQRTVATSSTAAETIALAAACKEAMWQAKVYQDVYQQNPLPVPMYEDNKGAVDIATNNKFSEKAKHLDVADKFAEEAVEHGKVDVIQVPTAQMRADIFTKPLGPTKFLQNRDLIMDYCPNLSFEE